MPTGHDIPHTPAPTQAHGPRMSKKAAMSASRYLPHKGGREDDLGKEALRSANVSSSALGQTCTPKAVAQASRPQHTPPKPYLILRDTLRSCEAYGMRPLYKGKTTQGAGGASTWYVRQGVAGVSHVQAEHEGLGEPERGGGARSPHSVCAGARPCHPGLRVGWCARGQAHSHTSTQSHSHTSTQAHKHTSTQSHKRVECTEHNGVQQSQALGRGRLFTTATTQS